SAREPQHRQPTGTSPHGYRRRTLASRPALHRDTHLRERRHIAPESRAFPSAPHTARVRAIAQPQHRSHPPPRAPTHPEPTPPDATRIRTLTPYSTPTPH